jgi:hypothetical protein
MNQLKRLAILLFCLASSPAFAACSLSLSGPVSQTALNYDPFAGVATATVSFFIQNTGDACASAFAFFRAGSPPTSELWRLDAELSAAGFRRGHRTPASFEAYAE